MSRVDNTVNKTYEELVIEFLSHPICGDEEFWTVQERIDSFLDLNREWTEAEKDYVCILGMTIQRYEEDNGEPY